MIDEEVELIVNRGGDADDVLRAVVQTIVERVAELVSTYVLLGWDTGGEAWSP